MSKAFLLAAAAGMACASAETYFKEQFNDAGWEDRWVQSEWKPSSQRGAFEWTAGKWNGGEESDKGIQTSEDARFYALSAKMDKSFNNKEKDLVIQFTVKHEQKIDCGGAYIKLLPSGLDQEDFGGDSTYAVMFGPDICGSGTKKTHAILAYEKDGELQNLENKEKITCQTDQLSHMYTMIIRPDNTYDVRIDGKSVQSGDLESDWSFLPDSEINDPNESKPADWVDEKLIPDPAVTKPEGYDDIPAHIPDPEAEMPEDWDEEDDGEWEAPMIENPDYQGEWKPHMIANPDYKGEWVHPRIANPAYVSDPLLHARCEDCEYVGFELWQVKAGTIFDDIIVTDSIEEAEAFAADTFEKKKDAEKDLFDAAETARKEKEKLEREEKEAARKAAEEEAAKQEADAEAAVDADEEEEAEEEEGHDEL